MTYLIFSENEFKTILTMDNLYDQFYWLAANDIAENVFLLMQLTKVEKRHDVLFTLAQELHIIKGWNAADFMSLLDTPLQIINENDWQNRLSQCHPDPHEMYTSKIIHQILRFCETVVLFSCVPNLGLNIQQLSPKNAVKFYSEPKFISKYIQKRMDRVKSITDIGHAYNITRSTITNLF